MGVLYLFARSGKELAEKINDTEETHVVRAWQTHVTGSGSDGSECHHAYVFHAGKRGEGVQKA